MCPNEHNFARTPQTLESSCRKVQKQESEGLGVSATWAVFRSLYACIWANWREELGNSLLCLTQDKGSRESFALLPRLLQHQIKDLLSVTQLYVKKMNLK